MGKFKDKSVLVTGAGVGIGYEICREFAQEGAVVALNDIDAELANRAAAAINQEAGRQAVYTYGCDVADLARFARCSTILSARPGGWTWRWRMRD